MPKVEKPVTKWLIAILVILVISFIFYLNLKPFLADIHYRKALELKRNIYYDEAVNELKKAIYWDYSYALYHKTLGELYTTMYIFRKDKKLIENAINELKISTNLNPNDGFSFASLGWAYYYKNDYSNAEKYFKISLEKDPLNSYFYYSLGILYKSLNRLIEAEYNLKKSLEIIFNNLAKQALEEINTIKK